MDGDRCPAINKSCTYIRENAALRAQLSQRDIIIAELREEVERQAVENAALRAQLKAAEARVKELEQGFREVLVCARNISEGYYEDAALLGRIARSFVGVKND